jgi:hypothetical protein
MTCKCKPTFFGATFEWDAQSLLIKQLRYRGLKEDVWLQHNGAPAHFTLIVQDSLNIHHPGHYIVLILYQDFGTLSSDK